MIPKQTDLRGNMGYPQASPAALPSSKAVAVPASDILQKIGYWFLVVYLFIVLSRVLDVTFGKLHLPAILYVGLILMALLSGGIFNVFHSTLGRFMLVLFGWCMLSVPFSTFRQGSAVQFEEVVRAFVLGVAIMAIPRTSKQTVRLVNVIAVALLGASVLTWFYGRLDYGRLVLIAGVYADPNEFAMTLLMALPLWVALAARARTVVGRVLAWACFVPVLITFLRTGSRGALFGFGAMMLFAFVILPMQKRLLLLTGTVAVILLSLIVLPNYILARYLTVFSLQSSIENLTAEEQSQFESDIGSSKARWAILLDSIRLTLKNPVFGVGLGQFPQQNWVLKKLQGYPYASRAAMVTHNVYTQYSSEAGIPALILFVALLFQCIRTGGKIVKLAPELGSSAQCLRLSLVVLASSGFFLAVAYSKLFYIMAGITARLYMFVSESRPQPAAVSIPQRWSPPPPVQPVVRPRTEGLPPRNKLSPWRTAGNNVRNNRLSLS
jgi:O-antigen ligase